MVVKLHKVSSKLSVTSDLVLVLDQRLVDGIVEGAVDGVFNLWLLLFPLFSNDRDWLWQRCWHEGHYVLRLLLHLSGEDVLALSSLRSWAHHVRVEMLS